MEGLVKGVNNTFIVLIPKVDVPLSISDYIPISLVGCIYKVLAKVLANWLSKVIGNVISVNQSAFVKGRQILDAEGLNAMVNASVLVNLFLGFSVGEDVLYKVTYLQFADDTLVVAEKNWANIRAIKAILLLFKVMSSLKVNFQKSLLVEVNVSDPWLEEAASVLHCKIGKTPFNYLGLPIGGNPRRLSFWKPVIDKIKSRLSTWKCSNMSMGGRLVLLKATLSSLPVYFLSFFKALASIVSIIKSLFKSFLWGGDEKARKWCWRLNTERDGFWREVLVLEYGESKGLIGADGRKSSRWWKGINSIKKGSFNGIDRWFDKFIFKQEEAEPVLNSTEFVWNQVVSVKVSVFAWRFMENQIPTRDNLFKRVVLNI
ncbi:ribonuclease H [Trifolium pratense]|uniref:Ribonuclease H n=1 Tax=Trifolium pratense TaxID=57577 RepID=A0A2K3L1L7_TRIPR|nr:ribonuclease H [Trifolium pratense]